jgi:hypothetical protein
LEDNVEDWRKRVTRAKVMCLFDSELTLRKIQEEELKEKTKLEDIEYKFQTIQEERQWAMTSLWRRNSERKWQEETRAKQVRVASQKRKWRINFFTKTGKPDKQRRAGHPWSKEAFADESHESFFLGGADLLLGRKGESPGRLGSQKALQTALAAVHLQSTQNTMVQYGSVSKKKILKIFEKYIYTYFSSQFFFSLYHLVVKTIVFTNGRNRSRFNCQWRFSKNIYANTRNGRWIIWSSA